MSLIKYFHRLQYIDFLIRRRATGDLKTFAEKNRLSKRNLTYVLKDMKDMGFPIKFNKSSRTYYYSQKGHLVAKLFIDEVQILSRHELKDIIATDVNDLCFSETSIFEPCNEK